jgi:glycosyltransferase involved in cell wall biosynthesis
MTNEIREILFMVFVSATAVQLFYIWFFHSRTAFYKLRRQEPETYEPVSVVIAARNEDRNLRRFLKYVLEQDYPGFEVIVVNDRSTDDTEFYLKSVQQNYPHLKIVNINNPVNFFKGKKFPLSIGIKSAKNDLLVLTDADCKPASPQWLKMMVAAYKKDTEVVLGYGAYARRKGLLNYIIRYETLRTAINYLSFARAGIPYMGVGRNLSYRKSLFYRVKGFQSHYKIQSGDDDLFVNMVANRKNTEVVISPDAKTISEPVGRFSKWIEQKRRHLTTGKHYKKHHLFLLAINDISYIFFITGIIILPLIMDFTVQGNAVFYSAIALRYLSFLLILKKSMLNFGETKLLLISPLLELSVAVLLPLISLTNIFYRRDKWK